MDTKPPTRTLPNLVMKEWPTRDELLKSVWDVETDRMDWGSKPSPASDQAAQAINYGGGRRSGKQMAMEQARDDFLRANPTATIATATKDGLVIEKHVGPSPTKSLSDFTRVVEETGVLDQERSQKDGSRHD